MSDNKEGAPPANGVAPAAKSSTSPPTWSLLLGAKPYAWAIAVAVFYVCGFLVLNAHLAKSGLSDTDLVSGRYFLAAANFGFFLICFYLFVGRSIVLVQEWLAHGIQAVKRNKPSVVWPLIVFLGSFVEIAFMACMSAATYTATALWQVETAFFYAGLTLSFIVSYTMDITNLDVRFPRFNALVQPAIRLWAIVVFFVSPNNWTLIGVFTIYMGMAMYINFVMDSFQRRGATGDKWAFAAVHSMFVLLSTAIVFGASFFGSVSSKLGGGRQPEALVALTADARALLPNTVKQDLSGAFLGRLVYQTDKHVFVSVGENTLRLRAEDVALITFKSESEQTSLDAFRKFFGVTPTRSDNGGFAL